jgi:hypothetical protein
MEAKYLKKGLQEFSGAINYHLQFVEHMERKK